MTNRLRRSEFIHATASAATGLLLTALPLLPIAYFSMKSQPRIDNVRQALLATAPTVVPETNAETPAPTPDENDAAVTATTNPDDAAEPLWLDAYKTLLSAQGAEQVEDYTTAIQLYQRALRQFQTVQRRYPSWNERIVAFRIESCQQQIQQLQSQVAAADTTSTLSPSQSYLIDAHGERIVLTGLKHHADGSLTVVLGLGNGVQHIPPDRYREAYSPDTGRVIGTAP